MADAEKIKDAGRRLAADLRELREARGVEAESILEVTRLSADIFRAFDETALVDHPAFNRVYLRSIVSSYAKVLEIDEDDGLKALEKALTGKYHGELRQKYLSTQESSGGPSFSLVEDDSDSIFHDDRDDGAEELPQDEQNLLDHGPPQQRSVMRPWGLIITTLIVVVLIVLWLIQLSPGSTDAPATLNEIPADSVSVQRVPEPAPAPERIILGDSIRFDIIAYLEALDPIRVTVDNDIRRPFWIDHLDTLTFFVSERIDFERELDAAEIWMDGFRLSDSLVDADGQLRMNRDRAQEWLDAAGLQLQRDQ